MSQHRLLIPVLRFHNVLVVNTHVLYGPLYPSVLFHFFGRPVQICQHSVHRCLLLTHRALLSTIGLALIHLLAHRLSHNGSAVSSYFRHSPLFLCLASSLDLLQARYKHSENVCCLSVAATWGSVYRITLSKETSASIEQ